VIVEYGVQFSGNEAVSPDQLNVILNNAVNSGSFGPDITVDASSISHNSMSEP
jgi:hypothetical protein